MKHIAAKVSIVLVLGVAPFAIASCSSSSSSPFDNNDSGGGGSDSGGKDSTSGSDGGTINDSGKSETSTATNGIGKTCTPEADGGMGQGDCDTGFVCLNLQDGTNPWCSKTCTQAADHCADGYTGVGIAQCIISVASVDYCGIICQDLTDGGICPPTNCNGTCPGTLACTGDLQNSASMTVAKSCQ